MQISALILASQEGNLESVKYLISKGANINDQDDDGDNALHFGKID